MSKSPINALDENRRRYYLDAMGIQCWASLNKSEDVSVSVDNVEVASDVTANDNVSPWSALNSRVEACVDCVLSQTRQTALPGRGNVNADVVVIVLAPDIADESSATVCSGGAGELLGKMLAAINVSVDDVYVTSLLKCRIPENYTVSPADVDACRPHLQQQLSLLDPKVVLVLGEITMRCLMQKNLSIDDFRSLNASAENVLYGLPLFASYSPHELLNDGSNKRKAWQDLQQLQQQINS